MKENEINNIAEFEFPESAEGFKELNRMFSPCGRIVLVVGARPDQFYTYALYCWDLSEYQYIGSGYWAPGYKGGIFEDLGSAAREGSQVLQSRIDQCEI